METTINIYIYVDIVYIYIYTKGLGFSHTTEKQYRSLASLLAQVTISAAASAKFLLARLTALG